MCRSFRWHRANCLIHFSIYIMFKPGLLSCVCSSHTETCQETDGTSVHVWNQLGSLVPLLHHRLISVANAEMMHTGTNRNVAWYNQQGFQFPGCFHRSTERKLFIVHFVFDPRYTHMLLTLTLFSWSLFLFLITWMTNNTHLATAAPSVHLGCELPVVHFVNEPPAC